MAEPEQRRLDPNCKVLAPHLRMNGIEPRLWISITLVPARAEPTDGLRSRLYTSAAESRPSRTPGTCRSPLPANGRSRAVQTDHNAKLDRSAGGAPGIRRQVPATTSWQRADRADPCVNFPARGMSRCVADLVARLSSSSRPAQVTTGRRLPGSPAARLRRVDADCCRHCIAPSQTLWRYAHEQAPQAARRPPPPCLRALRHSDLSPRQASRRAIDTSHQSALS